MALDEQKAKAAREAAYDRTVLTGSTLQVLEEALSFIERHSEPWYIAGQELCGLVEAAIANERLKHG